MNTHPEDYGYMGFEDWDDFNEYCDEADRDALACEQDLTTNEQ